MNKFSRFRNIFLATSLILIALIFACVIGGFVTELPPLFILFIVCLALGYACEVLSRDHRHYLYDKQIRYDVVNNMLSELNVNTQSIPIENKGERIILFDD